MVFDEITRVLTEDGMAVVTLPFSKDKTEVRSLKHSKWLMNLLYRYSKFWGKILGQGNLQYFIEQTVTDSIIKYYSLPYLQEILSERKLKIKEYKLIGKVFIRGRAS